MRRLTSLVSRPDSSMRASTDRLCRGLLDGTLASARGAAVIALVVGALSAPVGCRGHEQREAVAAGGPKPSPARVTSSSSFSPASSPSAEPTSLPLVQPSNLRYTGAFRLPLGTWGGSRFAYGGTALALGRNSDSLYIVGHDWDQMTAEISIPPLVNSTRLSDLHKAAVLQPFVEASEGLMPAVNDSQVKVGGLLARDGRLYGSAYGYYDAAGSQVLSHFFRADNLAERGHVSGMFRVGTVGAGFVSGYMTDVPHEWQPLLGGTAITGQCCLSIISRTSAGPAAFAFEPRDLGVVKPAPAQPLVHYPLEHALAPADKTNAVFNLTTEIQGVVLAPGTRSLLFFGSHGIGPFCYGTESECRDPYRGGKGPHAPPYVYQVWAYDMADLLQVKNARKQPWEVRPYRMWTFELPFQGQDKHIGGVAYQPKTRRLYVSQQWGDPTEELLPVIHAFELTF